MYQWLGERKLPHRKVGKLIVGTSDAQIPKMHALFDQGMRNDVEGLRFLTGEEAMALEPHLTCTAAVLSEETGILDSHAYMLSLQGDLEDHGGNVVLGAPVEGTEILPDGRFRIRVGGADPVEIVSRILVNSAGLYAVRTAQAMEGYDPGLLPYFTLAKGNYFSCQTKPVFSRLIYPAPVDGGLGVHITLDLGGRMRFGPDVEWIDAIEYSVDPARAVPFYAAIRRYWPDLPDGSLHADYSGIRPKIAGEAAGDFLLDATSGNLINLYGIESPGLTSSLAIAEEVRRLSKAAFA
jgi:L-2-hydroxyglutarate oxidase LhgO